MNCGNRGAHHLGYGASPAQTVDDHVGFGAHGASYAIIAMNVQEQLCDNSNCDYRNGSQSRLMDPEEILQLLHAQDMSQAELARRIGLDQDKMNKSLKGRRKITISEMAAIRDVLFDGRASAIGRSLPIIGQVAAGNWRAALQHPIGAMPAPDPSIPPNAFALRVVGDSMDLLVDDGATVVVDPDDRVLFNNRYYVVLNDEGEATFKQFKSDPARLVPCSSNAAHREIVLGGAPFDVVGRIIWRAARM